MTLTDLPQIRALSTREKLQLVDELWIEVAREAASLEVSPEEKDLLDERWNRFLNNPASALSLEEFQAQLQVLRS